MYLGLYSSLCFELAMIGISIAVLKTGSVNAVGRRVELLIYGACTAGGVAGFLGNYLRCRTITEDLIAGIEVSADFEAGIDVAISALTVAMSLVSCGLVALACVAYAAQRLVLRRLLREWAAANCHELDYYAGADPLGGRSDVARAKLLELTKQGCEEDDPPRPASLDHRPCSPRARSLDRGARAIVQRCSITFLSRR